MEMYEEHEDNKDEHDIFSEGRKEQVDMHYKMDYGCCGDNLPLP